MRRAVINLQHEAVPVRRRTPRANLCFAPGPDFREPFSPRANERGGSVRDDSQASQDSLEVADLRARIAVLEAERERLRAGKAAPLVEPDNETSFREFVDILPGMAWYGDETRGNVFVSRNYAAYTGRPPEALLGFGWRDVMHSDDLPSLQERLSQSEAGLTGGAFEATARFLRADGTWRWHLLRAQAHYDARTATTRWCGHGTDIHDQEELAAALRASRETLRLAVDTAGLGTWEADLAGSTEIWSDRCRELLGVTPDTPASYETFISLVHHADREAVEASWAAALDPERRALHAAELRIRLPDGSERWVATKGRVLFDESGRPVRGVGTLQDVTERRRSEQTLHQAVGERARALADTEARFRAVFEHSEDILFTVQVLPDGSFLHEGYNPWGEKRLGLPNEKVRGRRLDEFLPPETARGIEERLRMARDRGACRFRTAVPFRGAEGIVDVVYVPVRDLEGRVTRIVGVAHDVTELLRMEEQLRQTQKARAIGQLTGGVAHDFNNLLTGIMGSLELLGREVSTDRGRRLVEAALQGTARGARLTRQLLAFARRQHLQPRSLDLNALVQGMAALLGSTLGGAVKVETALSARIWPAIGDPTQLELAILNVAINARDAMPGGGTLRIATSNVVVDEPEGPHDPPKGEHVLLTITDTGTGMTPEVLDRAFEPFFTTKGVGQGSGLGLPQVLGLVQQLGGGVRIESRPRAGTTVRLFLPRALAKPEGAVAESTRIAPDATALVGCSVLLVDDDADARRAAQAMLTSLGCAVTAADGGPAALDAVARGSPFDLALIDHAMPGMTGDILARHLHELRPHLRVLLTTGYAESAPGGDGRFLPKPFTIAELASALTVALRDRVAA